METFPRGYRSSNYSRLKITAFKLTSILTCVGMRLFPCFLPDPWGIGPPEFCSPPTVSDEEETVPAIPATKSDRWFWFWEEMFFHNRSGFGKQSRIQAAMIDGNREVVLLLRYATVADYNKCDRLCWGMRSGNPRSSPGRDALYPHPDALPPRVRSFCAAVPHVSVPRPQRGRVPLGAGRIPRTIAACNVAVGRGVSEEELSGPPNPSGEPASGCPLD